MKMIFYLFAMILATTACDKNSDAVPPLTDIDGNRYDTVKIGILSWMKQNLNTSHYRNGDPIPEVTSMSVWASLTSGAWCWYNNDSVKYAALYGKLYNWYAVNDPRGLAPAGWHVPSDQEWTTLSTSLGGDLVAGGVLKEKGTKNWLTPNFNATNSSGFTGLPGGYRNEIGPPGDLAGQLGGWWSSTQALPGIAFYRELLHYNAAFNRGSANMLFGLSVRCLRD